MMRIVLIVVVLGCGGCAAQGTQCVGPLQPINLVVPAPVAAKGPAGDSGEARP